MKKIFVTLHDFVSYGGDLSDMTTLYRKNERDSYFLLGAYKNVYDARKDYYIKLEYNDFTLADIIKRSTTL